MPHINSELHKIKRIAILGSTGSIGTQTLEVMDAHPSLFEVEVLTAANNVDLLIQQAIKYKPNVVVIQNEFHYSKLSLALSSLPIKVYAGFDALAQVVEMDSVDMVVVAIVGFAGLRPTLKAIEARKTIAIANKETFVVAGQLVTQKAKAAGVNLYPVDSEHSAIFQCLAGEFHNPLEKIILTASGGPFRGKNLDFLSNVTPAMALKHPNWSMGAKITIDSASLMNKGLEVIEAYWLFGLKVSQIQVLVHPQSIIHSMVQFADGSIKAQLGLPDMKLPIQYALSYPHRLPNSFLRMDFAAYSQLTFEEPDTETFQNLNLAFQALENGGNIPCILNAANEMAVDAFLKEKIRFTDMPHLIRYAMNQATPILKPSFEDLFETDLNTRLLISNVINNKSTIWKD
jgi:1-deoxy-D-xylulose-5-phosphate reductoisomerase